ncbi:trypsin-like serine protease [Enhygromyxa salina]|uniref:Trypsin-like protease n=1 Tax=Enhygromyxa salina TaxID=215803 RepID=A0A2S9YSV1_9BACT|nr:trypsin-like serine protease [Enhygromyxa salina]PRQ08150.1 Trypsin-like protease precursor [Enhygromyxa salina]
MRRHLRILAPALLLLTLLPVGVKAAEPEVEAPTTDPLISSGTPAQNCQWPTTVLISANGGLCTGTLVHPQIVVTAAHCPTVNQVRFGESANNPDRSVGVDFCMRNPAWNPNDNNGVNGDDYAFCKLSQPVNDVPITPPMYGCELDMLTPNKPSMIVGFGANQGENGAGTKRWAQTIIQIPVLQDSEIVAVGENGTAACGGDSGGPAYFQFPDGSWHAFGIVSGGPPCGQGADTYSLMHRAVPFIEENSGIDITPCHDVDGTWNPTAACGGFATDPTNSSVSWNSGCATQLSGLKSTCGPAFGSPPDNNPPTVAIVDPLDGANLVPDELLDILVDAEDPEFAVVSVSLLIDGEQVATDTKAPWVFANASFPVGTFGLVAIAEDFAGNTTESATVTIIVGDGGGDGDGDPGDGDGDAGDDGEDSDGETGSVDTGFSTGFDSGVDTGPGIGDGDNGCACTIGPRDGAGGALGFGLGLLLLLGLRRRS